MLSTTEVIILGAGAIGLALALELHDRGLAVELWEQSAPASGASWAAAGMLAAHDPDNPPALLPLATYSLDRYPTFLQAIGQRSGLEIPFQTSSTVQSLHTGRQIRLAEHSIDPRQLVAALHTAVQRAGIALHRMAAGQPLPSAAQASVVVHATGAWAAAFGVVPRKGQMLRVQLPPGQPLHVVYRAERVYVVPRTHGPQAGSALIGATVEDVGFDTVVHPGDLLQLRTAAARLLPPSPELPDLADPVATPTLEAWAGLRPGIPDGLPLLGETRSPQLNQRHFVASGHFRNGILLTPGTAQVIADLIQGRSPAVDLQPFAPDRFRTNLM